MKKLAYYFSAALLGATVLFSSCKKDNEPTPTVEGKTYTSVLTANNNGTSGLANVEAIVSTSDGAANLRLDVSATNPMDQIFVMLSQDNGPFTPVSFPTITNALGQTFQGGSNNYSLKIPNLRNFIVDLPIPIRTAGVTDVYQVWITNGAGAFNKPGKNRDLGIATITLKYTAAASSKTFATATLNLGSQSSEVSSLLVTSGLVSVLNTADYNDSPESADIRLVTLTGGNKDNNSSAVFFYSPADVPTSGAVTLPEFSVPANSRTTKLEAYGGTDFGSITGAGLDALTVAANTNVQLTAGNVYKFETEDGRKGLIKVNSITNGTPVSGQTNARNVNATIKVLN